MAADKTRQIVCGAKNYKVGDKVPLALPGAVLANDLKIKASKLRGVESQGMLCSAKELGLSEESEGLLILSPDAKIGAPIASFFPTTRFWTSRSRQIAVISSAISVWPGKYLLCSGARSGCHITAGRQRACPARERRSISSPDECPFYSPRRIEKSPSV